MKDLSTHVLQPKAALIGLLEILSTRKCIIIGQDTYSCIIILIACSKPFSCRLQCVGP